MTAMIVVMRGMDPHTIRVTWVGMLGVSQSHHLGRATVVDSVVCLMLRLEENFRH
jgi:hypothetical protein